MNSLGEVMFHLTTLRMATEEVTGVYIKFVVIGVVAHRFVECFYCVVNLCIRSWGIKNMCAVYCRQTYFESVRFYTRCSIVGLLSV